MKQYSRRTKLKWLNRMMNAMKDGACFTCLRMSAINGENAKRWYTNTTLHLMQADKDYCLISSDFEDADVDHWHLRDLSRCSNRLIWMAMLKTLVLDGEI
jgi:hypothetical protein